MIDAASKPRLALMPTGRLKPPDHIIRVHLPAYSPELNPVERLWLYFKERFLSHRIFDHQHAIVEACAMAWNNLKTEGCASPLSPTTPTSERSVSDGTDISSVLMKNAGTASRLLRLFYLAKLRGLWDSFIE